MKPRTIDEYLAPLSEEQKPALAKLRKTILSVVPAAEECISYALPAFRLDGTIVAGFGAGKNHLACYPFSSSTVKQLEHELEGFETSKGAIRFQPDKPLPVPLVRRLIEARIAEG